MTIRTALARATLILLTAAGLAALFAPQAVAQLNRISAKQIACGVGAVVVGSSSGQSACSTTLSVGPGGVAATSATPWQFSGTQDSALQFTLTNTSATTNAFAAYKVVNGVAVGFFGATNPNGTGVGANSVPGGAHRTWLDISDNTSGAGWDIGGAASTETTRFYTGGYAATNFRATVDVNGLTLNNGTSIQSTATTGLAVNNVGANSCGTTAATIAGSNLINVITVGATSGTQCRITLSFAATTEWDCVAVDSTTASGVTKTTPVDTTHTDIFGSFTAGDKLTSMCIAR